LSYRGTKELAVKEILTLLYFIKSDFAEF